LTITDGRYIILELAQGNHKMQKFVFVEQNVLTHIGKMKMVINRKSLPDRVELWQTWFQVRHKVGQQVGQQVSGSVKWRVNWLIKRELEDKVQWQIKRKILDQEYE
jgi:hypothetical protein